MKTFNTLLIALLVLGLMISSCKKDDPQPDPTPTPTPTPTAKWPFATITKNQNGSDQFVWTYEQSDDKLTKIKWHDPNANTTAEVHTITYDGEKLTKMEVNHMDASKETITVAYDGDKVKKISSQKDGSTTVNVFELEYDAEGRVDQLNKYRDNNGSIQSLGFWNFTYDANGNVNSYTQLNKTYTLKYDDKVNPAYNSPEMLIITAGYISHYINHFWGPVPAIIALSKNNLIESTFNASDTRKLMYNWDSDGKLLSVDETWTINGNDVKSSWKMTY